MEQSEVELRTPSGPPLRRALVSGGGAASFVGGFPKMRSDFVQGVEPVSNNVIVKLWIK